MAQLWTNNALSSLAAHIAVGATSLSVVGDDGALFPSPTGGDYFYLTLQGFNNLTGATQTEIVTVTARFGNVMTVSRASEGTTAYAWPKGTNASLLWTADDFSQLQDDISSGLTATPPLVITAGDISLDLSAFETFTKVSFTYASSSPMVLQPVAPPLIAVRACIVLSTPFDDGSATLAVGTTTTPGLLLGTTDTDVLYDEQFESDLLVPFLISDFLQLTISPGASTQGAGALYYWTRTT